MEGPGAATVDWHTEGSREVETIKKVSEFVSQFLWIGKGHSVWNFDQTLLNEDDVAVAPDAVALAAWARFRIYSFLYCHNWKHRKLSALAMF